MSTCVLAFNLAWVLEFVHFGMILRSASSVMQHGKWSHDDEVGVRDGGDGG